MKTSLYPVLLTILCCLLLAQRAEATDYAYGYSSINIDTAAGIVTGYHRTSVDYNSSGYYTPWICGSLEKTVLKYRDGVMVAL
jgi:hypothetical protein